jgi:hypothetical protein
VKTKQVEQRLGNDDLYRENWKELRRMKVRGLLLFVLLFWGGCGLTLALLEAYLPSVARSEWSFLIFLPWIGASIVASFSFMRFRCPRCQALFHSIGGDLMALGRKCTSCGLRRGTSSDS